MSRISKCFESLKLNNRKALIPYITAGDPTQTVTVELLHTMVEAGADLIELGVPFSDPMADGPVIQQACERALQHNTSLADVLVMVKEFRKIDNNTPIVIMGYLNPIEIMGYQLFADKASEAGVDGVLIVDLPIEESDRLSSMLNEKNIDTIYLLAPTTEDKRISDICQKGSGYLYYVSVKGVTGSSSLEVKEVADKLGIIRQHTSLPIGVGFGIKDAETAAAVSKLADGVIVGSALVNKIAELADDCSKMKAQISALLKDMRTAMNN